MHVPPTPVCVFMTLFVYQLQCVSQYCTIAQVLLFSSHSKTAALPELCSRNKIIGGEHNHSNLCMYAEIIHTRLWCMYVRRTAAVLVAQNNSPANYNNCVELCETQIGCRCSGLVKAIQVFKYCMGMWHKQLSSNGYEVQPRLRRLLLSQGVVC